MQHTFKRLYSREEEQDREDTTTFKPRQQKTTFNQERPSQDWIKPGKFGGRREYDNQEETYDERKWTFVIDVHQFRPEEVKVKVDPVYHTLIITAKRISQPWKGEQEKCFKLKRVIPLPESIKPEELRVKFTPRGELIVKAPFHQREDSIMPQQQQQQRGGEIMLPVFFKDVLGKRQQEQLLPNGQVDVNKCSVQRYLRLLKNASFPNTMSTQCIRDEATGKWKIFFDINTVGFRREEVQVHFQEKERLLIVEAKHELRTESSQLPGISVKTLRREFILPEFVDGKQMRFRVMNTGVLRIQLPCLRDPCPKMCNRDEELEDQKFQAYYNKKQ